MKIRELGIHEYINHQNKKLFDELSKVYNIKLYLDPFVNSWAVDNNKPIIRTPDDDSNIAAFTHELLHIYLDYKGLTKKEDIYYKVFRMDVLATINKNRLFDHIYNVSSHKKMYPVFKRMGFKDCEFLENQKVFATPADYLIIKVCKRLGIMNELWISQFIGHFFAVKNDVIAKHKQQNQKFLYQLYKLDKELYRILYCFDYEWAKQDSLNCWDNYRELSNNFYVWLKENGKLKKR